MSWTKLESLSISNLYLSEKISRVVAQNVALFWNLVALILNWICVKSLIVTNTVQSLKGTGANKQQKSVSTDNNGQNICEKLQFSCEVVQYGKFITFISQQFSANIKKSLSLEGRQSTRLFFYKVLIFS